MAPVQSMTNFIVAHTHTYNMLLSALLDASGENAWKRSLVRNQFCMNSLFPTFLVVASLERDGERTSGSAKLW